jgi:hypothetical protein
MTKIDRSRTLAVVLLSTPTGMVLADGHLAMAPSHADWQLKRLMTPSPPQLQAESRGQVFIYDSLDINQVEAAMDENFERIQHMMFTRVRHPAPDPQTPAYLEDDGCD